MKFISDKTMLRKAIAEVVSKVTLMIDSQSYSEKPDTNKARDIYNRMATVNAENYVKTVSIPELAEEIGQGKTIIPSVLRAGTGSKNERFLHSQLFLIDIDNDVTKDAEGNTLSKADRYPIDNPITIDDIHSICDKNGLTPNIIYESFSSRTAHKSGKEWLKYHILFAVDTTITDSEQYEHAVNGLQYAFNGCDTACKDVGRLLFGTTAEKVIEVNEGVNSYETLLKLPQPPTAKPQFVPADAPRTYSKDNDNYSIDYDVLLMHISAECSREQWISISAAYKSEGGIYEVWHNWSLQGNYDGKENLQRVWNSIKGNKSNGSTLMYHVQEQNPNEWKAIFCESIGKEYNPQTWSRYEQTFTDAETNIPIEDAPTGKKEKATISISGLKEWLTDNRISLAVDVITHEKTINGELFKDIAPERRLNSAPALIYNEIRSRFKCSIETVGKYLDVIFSMKCNQHNFLLEKINGGKWDNIDRTEQIYKWLGVSDADTLSRKLIFKWLMMCYCALKVDAENTFPLDMVLVFTGEQGFGKSSLFKKLCFDKKYFGDGLVLKDIEKADNVKKLTSNWICELGEIERSMKTDPSATKAFISNEVDCYRNPYDRDVTNYPRRTCFCGTSNDAKYLVDDTGNRRFLSIPISSDTPPINVSSKEFGEFDTIQLWRQIQAEVEQLVSNGSNYSSVFRLTDDEKAMSENRNINCVAELPAERDVIDCIEWLNALDPNYISSNQPQNATEFIANNTDFLRNVKPRQLTKVLKKLGYTPLSDKSGRYMLPRKVFIYHHHG